MKASLSWHPLQPSAPKSLVGHVMTPMPFPLLASFARTNSRASCSGTSNTRGPMGGRKRPTRDTQCGKSIGPSLHVLSTDLMASPKRCPPRSYIGSAITQLYNSPSRHADGSSRVFCTCRCFPKGSKSVPIKWRQVPGTLAPANCSLPPKSCCFQRSKTPETLVTRGFRAKKRHE